MKDTRVSQTHAANLVANNGNTLYGVLIVSRYALRVCIWVIFLPSKFDHVNHFDRILLGPISNAPHFQHVNDLLLLKVFAVKHSCNDKSSASV